MSEFFHLPTQRDRPRWQWWFVFVAAPVAFGLGAIGFWQYQHHHTAHPSVMNSLYHSAQLFVLHIPHLEYATNIPLEIGRWLAAAVFGIAALSALYYIFAAEVSQLLLSFTSNHIVVCGLGRRGIDLVRCYRRDRRQKVVVLERDASAEMLAACRRVGATLVLGEVTDPAFLRRVRVHKAKSLVAVCGGDETNIEIAVRAVQFLKGQPRSEPLEAHVHISDLDLRVAFQRNRLLGDASSHCKVNFFDLYESTARRLLLETLPMDHSGVRASDPRQVHLIILGFGRMGRAVAVKAAQLGHFLNGKSVKISVIDRDAARHEQSLLFRYPAFRDTCQIEFHPLEAESPRTRGSLDTWLADANTVSSVVVCFDNDALGLEIALRLLPSLRHHGIPIGARMASRSGLATLLQEGVSPREVSFYVRLFGNLDDDGCERALHDPRQDTLAKIIQLRFIEHGKKLNRLPDVDTAMRSWETLPEDYKDSNRQQADHLAIKLRAIGCEIVPLDDPRPEYSLDSHVEALAELEHERWIAERLLAGWSYAPGKKNETLRTNPNLIPWAKLDENTKSYDRDTIQNIPHVLKALSRKVCQRDALQ